MDKVSRERYRADISDAPMRYCPKCKQYEFTNVFTRTTDDPLGQYCLNCKEKSLAAEVFKCDFKFNIGDSVYLYHNPACEYTISSRLFTYIESKSGIIYHRSYTVDYSGNSYPVTLREHELTLANGIGENNGK